MKIIYGYILREFAESLGFGLMVFSIILLLDQIFQLINLVLSKGIALAVVFQLFVLILPNIFSLALPMAVLFGILLSFGRLSEDNEITALRAAGVSYRSFTLPPLIMAAVISCFLIYFNHELSPNTHRHFRTLYQEVLSRSPLVKFNERSVITLGEFRIYAEHVDRETNTLRGVNLFRFDQAENGMPWRISAASASVSVSPAAVSMRLFSGAWQKPDPSSPEILTQVRFGQYAFSIPLGSQAAPFSQSLREMTSTRLRREIADYTAKHLPANFLENEFWLRWTLALAPFVFALAGIPLGAAFEKRGKSIGFGVSLAVIFIYYTLLVTAINVGEKGYSPPWLIMWLPDLVVGAAGVALWRRMVRR